MRTFGPYHGTRGHFSVATGCVGEDVLAWLRQDVLFQRNSAALQASWEPRAGRRVENNVKLEVGLLGNLPKSTTCNGLACRQPFERLKEWVKAFKTLNKPALAELSKLIKSRLAVLDDAALGKNGRHLRDSDPVEWAFELSTAQFMKTGVRLDPIHFDGGASLLLMAVSLWGSRITHLLLQEPDKQQETRASRPRNVAVSNLAEKLKDNEVFLLVDH